MTPVALMLKKPLGSPPEIDGTQLMPGSASVHTIVSIVTPDTFSVMLAPYARVVVMTGAWSSTSSTVTVSWLELDLLGVPWSVAVTVSVYDVAVS